MSERVQRLVQLQDLELMIEEVRDPDHKQREEALGFTLENLAQLEKAHERLLKQVPSADLRVYQRIRGRHERAVVPVLDRICLGCFQTLPTRMRRGAAEEGPLPACENCGRILYWF